MNNFSTALTLLLLSYNISLSFAFSPLPDAIIGIVSRAPLLTKNSAINSVAKAAPFSISGPSQELLDLFNSQVTKEFAASQLYLSASIWFNSREWEGMASYMLAESAEERSHALQFVDFASKRNIPIDLQTLDAPKSQWESPEEVWQAILELEQTNTASLLQVAQAANECQDFAVLAFLNPFHMEQVNSEATISAILAKVKDENKTPGLLRQLDHELGMEAGTA